MVRIVTEQGFQPLLIGGHGQYLHRVFAAQYTKAHQAGPNTPGVLRRIRAQGQQAHAQPPQLIRWQAVRRQAEALPAPLHPQLQHAQPRGAETAGQDDRRAPVPVGGLHATPAIHLQAQALDHGTPGKESEAHQMNVQRKQQDTNADGSDQGHRGGDQPCPGQAVHEHQPRSQAAGWLRMDDERSGG